MFSHLYFQWLILDTVQPKFQGEKSHKQPHKKFWMQLS